MYSKICLICSKQFSTKSKPQKYCSYKCRDKAHTKSIKSNCVHCGKLIITPRAHAKRGNGKFCSKECIIKHHSSTLICKTCGKKIVRAQWENKGKTFCSLKCAYGNRKIVDDKKGKYFTCINCGKLFYLELRHCKKVNNAPKYCSVDCRRKYEWLPKRTTKKCLCCDKEFISLKTQNTRFCSFGCYRKYNGESSIEKKFRLCLEERGIKYIQEKQFRNYSVDFIIGNIAVEIDGNYWHDKESVKRRDKLKEKVVTLFGYKVIRFTEDEIKNSVNDCINKIPGV